MSKLRLQEHKDFLFMLAVIRCESILRESTSKPSIPKDLQELLDSLYMNGFIPEYILPEDELTETEKTEGEYLDFPELKNAQDDVFVPPESEYSKNSLHYKNIKPRKRLIPDKRIKIKISSLHRDILQPGISPEELRSDLMVHLAENLTGKPQKYNSSVKLDFLIPIPDREVYPFNNIPTENYNLNERFSSSKICHSNNVVPLSSIPPKYNSSRPTEPYKPQTTELNNQIQQGSSIRIEHCRSRSTEPYKLQPTEHSDSVPPEVGNIEPTTSGNSRTTEFCKMDPTRSDNSRVNEVFITESTRSANYEICNTEETVSIDSRPTELCNIEPTENCKVVTIQACDVGPTELMDKKRINPQWPMNIPNIQVLFEIPQPPGSMNNNTQVSMKISNSQKAPEYINTPTPTSQAYVNSATSQGSIKMPNLPGSMKIPNTQGPMKIPNPQGTMNLPNPTQWYMNQNNVNKESTQHTTLKQYLFTGPEYATKSKYQEFKPNNTMSQPYTFEIIGPKTEKETKTFQLTTTMQFQRNVTIKPALEQQIKSMLNIQLWPKQLPLFTTNIKQSENGFQDSLDTQSAASSLMPKINRTIQGLEGHTIRTEIDNSSKRLVLKMIDKNIATNVVSLMADPSSINRIEAEGTKPVIKPSFPVNNEIKQDAESNFELLTNNVSEIIKPLSQNTKNKERKNVNQNYKSNSSGKETAESGKPKKKIFTFLNIFKKNKKYPPSEEPGQNSSAEAKREAIENSSNELYRQLLENNAINDIDDGVENQYPIKQEFEDEETFNHKRKKK